MGREIGIAVDILSLEDRLAENSENPSLLDACGGGARLRVYKQLATAIQVRVCINLAEYDTLVALTETFSGT